MNALLRVTLILTAVFVAILIVMKGTGLLTIARIEDWIHWAGTLSPMWVAALVIALLAADLVLAVPTIAVTLLAGYVLGHPLAAVASILGMLLAGAGGYLLSLQFGDRLMALLLGHAEQRAELEDRFARHGFTMILFSRAVPMMPEVTACMAGMTRMPFGRFMLAWSGATIPYALVATWSGSISSPQNPLPAVLGGGAVFAAMWIGGLLSRWRVRAQRAQTPAMRGGVRAGIRVGMESELGENATT